MIGSERRKSTIHSFVHIARKPRFSEREIGGRGGGGGWLPLLQIELLVQSKRISAASSQPCSG